ncbi:MAG: hypothetical protein CFH21_00553 [Alphaproteobacteria bacterium MarineAlpha5_Bin11]|nr:hypothetical protein [Pelagibacteraceae bacterium]PPR44033.1 MAG: hypothetical protein CFH21_00553 [Alphaproteobacteria bacterium MarineAlpha5_Bin11]PPR52004.1 MAG: hypothetical protein CFH20_00192 [Alphaproteobacteria bacterium MarineAlpha5_Bin10]|tara:strand:- start:84 stop:1199 length:1116 start_codon:yes stop_codon:yes gene_type:complete
MTLKTFLSENKYAVLAFTASLIIIITFAINITLSKYNYDYFINKIESQYNLKIEKKGDYSIIFFPKIIFKQNNMDISKKSENFSIFLRNLKLEAIKEYSNLNNTNFKLNSPSTVINGIPLRDLKMNGKYKKQEIEISNLFTYINEGELNLTGKINTDKETSFDLTGNFTNISLTTLLSQAQLIDWKRLSFKIRSDFVVKSKGKTEYEIIKNLNANLPIKGIFLINATQEERFGTALLNLLTEKIPEISKISQSLDFIISKFADIPSRIEGTIIIENGVVKTNELFIINDYAKMRVNLFYNILQDKIDGKLFFYKEDNIYLTTEIKGNIRDPSILVGGQPFITKDSEEPLEDIKKIINEGITNIFQKLLEEN